MNEFFTNMQQIARTLRLSQNEKQAIRARLLNYMDQFPVEAAAPIIENPSQSVPSPFYFFAPRYSVSFAAVLLVLFSGTAFAAQGSLPGDTLYPLKISVNERVATALATTPEEKAQVNAQLATTRLEEAEALASTGKLDATTTAALAINFAAHVTAAKNNTNTLFKNDPGAASQLGAEFDSTLSAHSAILAQIGDDSDNSQTMENSNDLATRVRESQANDRGGDNNDNSGDDAGLAIATDTSASSGQVSGQENGQGGARVRTFAAKTTIAPQAATPPVGGSASATVSSTSASHTPSAKPATFAKTATASKATSTVVVHNPKDAQAAAALGAQA